jgi:hypothetical protein
MDEQIDAPAQDAEDKPEVSDARKALVKDWCDRAEKARKHWHDVFKAMRESQDFALRGCDKAWADAGNYVVPILPRYINQSVSQLYARNPKVVFKRRRRLMRQLWDGRADTLQGVMEAVAMGDMTAFPILQEVLAVREQNMMFDRMGETLQILWEYFLNEQEANYKQQIKAAVRRAKTSKVAWIKLGYQRLMEPRPETAAGIDDVTSKIGRIEQLLKEASEDRIADYQKEAEELRLNLADLERDQFLIVREGPVLDFPKSYHVYPDEECVHLKSLTGARFVVHEYEKTPQQVERTWGVKLGDQYTAYDAKGEPSKADVKDCRARIYEIWDKENKQTLTVCDGYCDFLVEPKTPPIYMERFWPFFPIVFNESEHYDEIYPLSDVEHAKHIQNEYNRSREALREHRIAAKPYWLDGAGLSDEEKNKLANHAAHEVISIPRLAGGEKVEDLIQRGPTAPIDPNLYELESHFSDLMRVVGYQEAQIGGVSGGTATESSIAQQSQSAQQSDNVDDLDEVLAELARAAGQVMLLNVQKATVVEIVGDGAVWPDAPETREAAAKELYLEVEAGSSGRPNQAAELANMERAVPLLERMPEVNPRPLVKKYLGLLDIDMEEGIAEGLPSMTAMNALVAKMATNAGAQPTGDPRTDPNAQGMEGAQNAPGTQTNEPGPQPAYTPPMVA